MTRRKVDVVFLVFTIVVALGSWVLDFTLRARLFYAAVALLLLFCFVAERRKKHSHRDP
jgi:flagellar biosynthesis component FlhA